MDCLVSTTDVDIERIADDAVFAKDFTIVDSYQPGAGIAFADIKNDAEFSIARPDTNFQSIAAKSRKGCTGVKKENGGLVYYELTCTDLNLHYYRNFETTEKTQDGQMTLAIAGEKIPFYGFVQTAADDKFTKGAKTATGKVVGIAPVTPAFKAAAEKKPDAGGDGGENKPTEEDSASQMTAAIVAVSALAALF
mgnify:CR=1 FL=1